MQKKTAELEIKSNIPSIKQQLKDATNELIKAQEAFGDYSEEAINAAKQVAKLKDQISEARETADLFDPGNKMKAFGGAMQAVGAGFETAIGGMGLLGGEGKKLEETLLKVNSAIAMSDGISRLVDSGKDFNRFKTIAVSAFNGVKGAIGATGIGLFLIAAGLIVANFDAIKKKVIEVFPAFGNMGNLFGKIKEIAFGAGEAIKNYVLMPFKALGKVLQGDFKGALAEVKNGFNVIGNFQKGAEKERGDQQKAAAKERLANDIAENEKRLEVLKARGKDTYAEEKRILNQKLKLNAEDKAETAKLNQEKAVLEAGHQKKLEDIQKAANDKAAAAQKAANDKKKAEREAAKQEEINSAVDKYKRLDDLERGLQKDNEDFDANTAQKKLDLAKKREQAELDATILTADQKKLLNAKQLADYENDAKSAQTALDTKYANLQTALNKEEQAKVDAKNKDIQGIIDGNAIKKSLTDAKNLEELNAIYAQLQAELDAKQAAQLQDLVDKGASGEQIAALKASQEQQDLDLTKQFSEAKKKVKDLEEEHLKKKVAAIGNTLAQASELLGEHTVAGKALAIAATTISTYQSAVDSYKGMVSAIPGPVGIAAGAVAAAASVATGLATVKKIISTKVPTKAGGGAGGGSAPSAPPKPSVSFQNTAQTQIGDTVASATQNRSQEEPLRAVVVLKDVKSAEELDRNIVNGSKF
ncbi:hypothetical protein ABGT15_04260 [Flavobacterium enshiense]|uniref:hypothetical protein n=1 Tax=Flavobacterium enshiense TaxID=1341165 RepID=UPI00345C91D5